MAYVTRKPGIHAVVRWVRSVTAHCWTFSNRVNQCAAPPTTRGDRCASHRPHPSPASFSLKEYALEAGNQGAVGSCVAWATGYTGIGLLAKEQGKTGYPFAPMFVYAQIAQGDDTGTWAGVALPIEEEQGIDTKEHYWQGDFDYTTQPDEDEIANAANYKITGFTDLTDAPDREEAVKEAIASGLPVPIGFELRSSFEDLDSSNYTYDPSEGEEVLGGHEVTIIGYDEEGVEIENSWGSDWGNEGYFKAPWSFITGSDVDEIHSIGKLAG